MYRKRLELKGKKFNNWLVIDKAETQISGNQTRSFWLCECVCKVLKNVYSNSLVSGKSKSCGCVNSWKKPYGMASRRNVFSTYKSRANRKSLEFKLTEDQFSDIAKRECFYCGKVPSNVHRNSKMNGDYTYNGVDRIDNSKGYTIENVVACCKNCNKAKLDLSLNEFFTLIKKIYERNGLNEKR